MSRNIRTTTGARPGARLLIGGTLIAAALIVTLLFGWWDTARAQAGVNNDREAVWMTVDTVFEGWRRLDLNVYMSPWDNGAVQYLRKGISRNYSQIRADRADAFTKYNRVDATWTADSIEIYGGKAFVVVTYSMTFYRKDGKVIHENEKEFYVLKQYPDSNWGIVENYDYLPR
jgi:hypothetical protein